MAKKKGSKVTKKSARRSGTKSKTRGRAALKGRIGATASRAARTLGARRVPVAAMRGTVLGRAILETLDAQELPDDAIVTEPPWAHYARAEGRL